MGDAHHIHVLDWAVPASAQQSQVMDGDMGCGLVFCLDLIPGADTEPVGRLKWPAGWGSVGSLAWFGMLQVLLFFLR